MKYNPRKIREAVYNACHEVLSNPMPMGAVCTTGPSRQEVAGNIPIGKIFYITDGEGERIFKMRMIEDVGGTGRFMKARLIRIVQTHPKNMAVGEYFLDRIRDKEITLVKADDRYLEI